MAADAERTAQRTAQDRATIARLADEVVPALIERLAKSELGELEVREAGWRIMLRRPVDGAAAPLRPVGPGTAHTAAPGGHAPVHAPPREAPRGLVTSPAVGYFAPRGGVEPGAQLRSGDLIGHVDVLGVRHEVVSGVDGALKGFEVESGQAVEFGQPIARVEVEA
jgi:acetyl-CoA carboxylase biotin carboxyl carrier protein